MRACGPEKKRSMSSACQAVRHFHCVLWEYTCLLWAYETKKKESARAWQRKKKDVEGKHDSNMKRRKKWHQKEKTKKKGGWHGQKSGGYARSTNGATCALAARTRKGARLQGKTVYPWRRAGLQCRCFRAKGIDAVHAQKPRQQRHRPTGRRPLTMPCL